MASRLYRTRRRLYGQVEGALRVAQVVPAVGGTPTMVGLVALSVTGRLLLDARRSQPRMCRSLPRPWARSGWACVGTRTGPASPR